MANRRRSSSCRASVSGVGSRSIVEGHVDAQARDGLQGLREELELLLVDPGLVHAGEAPGRGLGDPLAEHALLLVGQPLRDQPPDELHGALLQDAGGLALRVAHDLSARRVLRLAGDAREAQRHGVGPAGVAVVGDEEGRAARHQGVELQRRGEAAGERGVGPPPAGHPVGVGVGRRPALHALREGAEGEVLVEAQLLEREAPAQQVQVAVDEAGRDEAPAEVHDLGALPRQLADVGARADREHRRPAHGEGLDEGPARLAGPHPAADEDAVGLAAGPPFRGRAPGERGRKRRDGEDRHATRHGRPPSEGPGRQGPGTSVSTWTAGPGRKGVFSPFAQAACPSA